MHTSKILLENKYSASKCDYHCVLLYTGSDESGDPLFVSPKLKKLGIKEKTAFEYHLDTLIKNKLHDIVIVTVKKEPLEVALTSKKFDKFLVEKGYAKEVIEKLHVRLYSLKDIEDSTVKAMQFVAGELTKDLIIFHGQYLIDLNLKDAIAEHKINSSEMTLVLKKSSDLDLRAKKSASDEQFNIYGIGKGGNELYAMFNSFEAADTKGLTVYKSVLSKCPGSRITLRSDLNDTGVYIMRNMFTNELENIQTIDFDLVKLVVNNQHKKKLRKIIGQNSPDEDTEEIDELLNKELGLNSRVKIVACIKEADEMALDMNIVNSQVDSDQEGGDGDDGNNEMTMSDSD